MQHTRANSGLSESDGSHGRPQGASGRRRSSMRMDPHEQRLTPITGRVSKAKKGLPVHYCDICGRVFVFPFILLNQTN
jgi:hypothetical protein